MRNQGRIMGGSKMVQEKSSFPDKEIGSDQEQSTQKFNFGPSDFDEASCPICMERWSSQGDHQASCHVGMYMVFHALWIGELVAKNTPPWFYIFDCTMISKFVLWSVLSTLFTLILILQCPQCNSMFKLEDIRKLYCSPPIRPDENLKKQLENLKDENDCLKIERKKNEELKARLAAEQEVYSSQLSDIVYKLTSERKTSFDAYISLVSQLKGVMAERDDLSGKLSLMDTLVTALKDRLDIAHAPGTLLSQYATNDILKLQTEILKRLREIEIRAFTAEDRVMQLEADLMEVRARIPASSVNLLSNQSSGGDDSS